jgi:hypothetical protein
MFNLVATLLMSLRANWRWAHGHCPLCNRNLYAKFPRYLAGSPNCPVCKDETETDLRMGLWGGLAEFPAESGLVDEPASLPVEARQ